MSNIKVNLSVASGGGGYAVEFHSGANTLSCTVSAAGLTTCGAGTLSVTAGDLFYVKESNGSPAPTTSATLTWSATFN